MLFSVEALATGAINNLLVLLGAAFLISRGLVVLGGRPHWQRVALLGAAFAATAIASISVSFVIAPGIIGDLRNAVIAVAALTGGPLVAVVTAVAAAVYRIAFGGHALAAIVGIAVATALSIGFAMSRIGKGPLNLGLFGLVLAAANAALPLVFLPAGPAGAADPLAVFATVLVAASIFYPLAILVIGGFLAGELKRIDAEAELHAANALLNENQRRFTEVFDLSSVAMAWGDLKTLRFIRVNAAYAAFTGYSEAELLGMRITEVAVPEDGDKDIGILRPLGLGEVSSHTGEKRYRRKDGAIVWGMRMLTTASEGGDPRFVFAMVQDITEQKRDRERIVWLAEHDPLTGLGNRRVVYDRLDAAIATLPPDGELATLYLDLDDFKEINDTLGHAVGDALLVQVGRRLKACTTEADAIARLSGDGFAVLHRSRGPDDIRELARRVLALVGLPFEIEGEVVTLGASMGIAVAPRDGAGSAELFKKADIALHAAKADGRGVFRFFEPAMEGALRSRQVLKTDLANALDRGEFAIVYQPIINAATGAIAAFEALIRWNHPARGVIPPADFIPIAEETGQITRIGEWVLEQACLEAAKWPGRIGLAVNVSPRQFQARTLPLHVATAVLAADLNPNRLELEITESVLFQGSEANLAILHDLRALGVRIALDDFGTGYSALGYLLRFPIDRIKIDRAFVNDLPDRDESKAVVSAIVGLGRSLGMRVTAEGVETLRQLDEVRARGCHEAQGYHFSRPVPAEDIPALLSRFGAPILREVAAG